MSFVFDSHELGSHDGLALWNDVIWSNYVPLDIRLAQREEFYGRVTTGFIGDVRVATSCSQPQSLRRTPRLIRDDSESYVMLGLQRRGNGTIAQNGNRAELSSGDFALWDTRVPYDIDFPNSWQMNVFQFPREALGLPEKLVAGIVGRRFPGTDAFFRAVSLYLGALASSAGSDDLYCGEDVRARTIDLIRTAIETRLGTPAASSPEDALRRRIQMFVEKNLSSPDLSPACIAREFAISTRYLHRLFAGGDETVGGHIRALRMAGAKRELENPRSRHKTVAAIARTWGYGDAPHFTREFKRLYGLTPGQCRTAQLEPLGHQGPHRAALPASRRA
ncbi:MAG: AraC family transcriptional regulator [Nocardioides sp.]|nr:AraC family transcriptional regulator [Nocardioides sp.]